LDLSEVLVAIQLKIGGQVAAVTSPADVPSVEAENLLWQRFFFYLKTAGCRRSLGQDNRERRTIKGTRSKGDSPVMLFYYALDNRQTETKAFILRVISRCLGKSIKQVFLKFFRDFPFLDL